MAIYSIPVSQELQIAWTVILSIQMDNKVSTQMASIPITNTRTINIRTDKTRINNTLTTVSSWVKG